MKHGFLVGLLVLSVACSSKKNSSTATGGAGGVPGSVTGGASGTSGPVDASVSGTGGMGGVGGTSGTAAMDATGGSGPPPTGASVLERNKNPSRDGRFIDANLTRGKVMKMVPDTVFKAAFDGQVWASPLYLENGPGGKGVFFAVNNNNDVIALDETTGAVVWKTTVAPAAPSNGVPCGSIHPLGILATPVIDATARTIYVSNAAGTGDIDRDEVHALNVDDGKERTGWPVNVSKTLGFDPKPHNPRSALSLVNGILYVAYGGHVGDCGDYRGRVVTIDTKDPTKVAGWITAGAGEAIWASGGMASDGDGVIAITGNRIGGDNTHQDSEEVVRIGPSATVANPDTDIFYPKTWRTMDSSDADFGANSPVLINVPGATPANMVAAVAKDGHLYFLDAKRFGGMGGQLVDYTIASNAMSIRTVPAAYATSKGSYLALNIVSTPACPPNMPNGAVIMGIFLAPGAPVKPQTIWCAAAGSSSPVSSVSDGTTNADPFVWFMNGDKLTAVEGDTGNVVFTSPDSCPGVRQWTSPIIVKGRVITTADGRMCAWKVP
jgi:hypothetical protein